MNTRSSSSTRINSKGGRSLQSLFTKYNAGDGNDIAWNAASQHLLSLGLLNLVSLAEQFLVVERKECFARNATNATLLISSSLNRHVKDSCMLKVCGKKFRKKKVVANRQE